jgi:hypothetical protein
MQTKQIYYKSDFSITEKSESGYAMPFRFIYYAASPSRPFVASFDGQKYTNCQLDESGNLLIGFDDHNLGCGTLMVQRKYYLNSSAYASGVCDEEIAPAAVVIQYEDSTGTTQEANIVMALQGDSDINAKSTVSPYWAQGKDGSAATVKIGTVTELDAGSTPTVTNSGNSTAAVLDFGLPKPKDGTDGVSSSIKIGTVETSEPGANAEVSNSGDEHKAVFNFKIPRGAQGPQGVAGGILFPKFEVNPVTGYLTVSGSDADISRISFNPVTGCLIITL